MAKKTKADEHAGMVTTVLYLKRQAIGAKSFVVTEHWVWGNDGANKFMAARQEEAYAETKRPYQVSVATQAEYREKNWHSVRA